MPNNPSYILSFRWICPCDRCNHEYFTQNRREVPPPCPVHNTRLVLDKEHESYSPL